jgi:hypothetical protein
MLALNRQGLFFIACLIVPSSDVSRETDVITTYEKFFVERAFQHSTKKTFHKPCVIL